MSTTHPNAVQILTACKCNFTGTGDATVIQGKASHRVVWHGLVYALLMVLAKMAVGVWMLVWPELKDTVRGRGLARKGTERRNIWSYLYKLRWSLWAAHRDHNRGRNSEYADEGRYEWNATKTKERGHDGDEEIGKSLFDPMPDLNASSELKLEPKVNVNAQESLAEDTTRRPRQVERGYGEERAMVDDHTEASLSPASLSTTPSSSSPLSSFRRQSGPLLINVVPGPRNLHPDRVNQQGPKQASPSSSADKNINHDIENNPASNTPNERTRLLGMVARGEIALIIAQLSRPLLLSPTVSTTSRSTSDTSATTTTITTRIADEELTVGGALGVGALVGSWKRRDEQKA
ncbi:hypothetical protein BDZ97DRAFT_1872648 [Flammula alnicola]|nr:hypothetical protein BDZ97DRAFT_1872648 [Flammula alnicola]